MARGSRLFLALVFLSGCGTSGPALHPVSGTLTLDGQPLAAVTVNFFPVDQTQPSSAGLTDAQGRFTVTAQNGEAGAVAGKHKVVLSGGATSGDAAGSTPAYMQGGSATPTRGGGSPTMPSAPQAPYPTEYASADTTPKEVEVTSGSNDVTIAINSGGGS